MKMYYLNNLKSGISTLIGLICAISIPLSAFAAEEDENWDKGWWDAPYSWLEQEADSYENGIFYTLNTMESVAVVTPTRYDDDGVDGGYYEGILRIPEKAVVFFNPDGYPVTGFFIFGRNGVTELYLPKTIEKMHYTVYDCSLLTKVSFAGETSFHDCFTGCPAIREVECLSAVPPVFGENSFTETNLEECVLYVPKEAIPEYMEADGWKDFGTIRELESLSAPSIGEDVPDSNDNIYDLMGRKVQNPVRGGIYIRNGKKLIWSAN
jgi:hypothetical protein